MAMRAVGTAGQPASEAVVQAASRILAALISNGRYTEGNRASMVRFAVGLALDLAQESELAAVRGPEPRAARAPAPADAGAAPASAREPEVAADDILDLLD